MNRRELLQLALLSCASAAYSPKSAGAIWDAHAFADVSLRDLASQHRLIFGSSARRKQLELDDAFRTVFLRECGILVPELELKWAALRPAPDQYDFADADWMCSFAESHGLLFRGHTLVWDAALPAWFSGYANRQNAAALMTDHIKTVVGRYRGKVRSWDVVNEAIELTDGRPDGLKKSPWLELIGPEYIQIAFRTAHEADPNALLVYNENFLEPETAASESKRQVTLRMLADLKKKNVPLDALGIQAHVYAEANVSGPGLSLFLREISNLGLKILVTEMDVRDKNLPAAVDIRDREVADQYFRFLHLLLSFPATEALLTWGLTDRYTWISKSHPRMDGLPVRPLPYDNDWNPTPSRDAIARAIEMRPGPKVRQ